MKGQLKSNTVDKYLRPVRRQIVELVEPDASVVEFGCGNGDLLFQLSNKIKHGVGLDYAKSLIEYANKRKRDSEISNLDFNLVDLIRSPETAPEGDYAIASLVFHVLPQESALKVLQIMSEKSEHLIICAFSQPQNWMQKALLWMDQRFSGHYNHFKTYSNQNYMEGLFAKADITNYEVFDTFDPVIKIYRVKN